MSRKRICAFFTLLIILLTNTLSVQWKNGTVEIVEQDQNVVTASAQTIETESGETITLQGTFGDGFKWGTTDDGKTLYITGSGEMYNFNDQSDKAPWAENAWQYETVIVEGNVTSIGDYAFAQCTAMTNLVLPDSVTRIGNYAFDNCNSWTSYDLSGITSIGTGAFQYCGFTTVEIPESVEEISTRVFFGCGNVTEFSVATGSALCWADFYGALFNSESNTLMAYPKASEYVESYSIPEGITALEDGAFSNTNVGTVVFPSTMVYIESGSCAENSFTSLTIPNTVTGIGQGAFRASKNLTSVTIPGSVGTVEQGAFGEMENLTEIIVEDGVTWLHDYAFENNPNLEYVTIPASVTTISRFLFNNSNENVIIKGYTNSTAEVYANQYDYTFESIGTVEATVLGSGTCGAAGNEENVSWTLYNNGVLEISGSGDMADYGDYWDQSICAPWLVDEYRMKIVNVVIEEGVTSIGSYAFDYCEALIGVTISDTVTSIGARAFKDTRWADPVVPKNVTYLGSGAFHIPAEFLNSLSVEEGNTFYVVYEGGLYDADKTILYKWGLGDAFEDGEFNVVLPSTVKTIGIDAFCGSIVAAVTLNEGLETIEERAFYNAHNITELHIPSTVTSIGADALSIDNITQYTVGNGNTAYTADKRGALFSADMKTLYYYPQSNTERFYAIPHGVEEVKNHALNFKYVEGLLIPASVKTIEREEIELQNPNSLDNRHILLYGYRGSYAETYAATYQYKTWNQNWDEVKYDHEFLVIPTKHYKRLKIHCPVDVYVYDTEDNLVASVVDEQVVVYNETIYADEMEKTVYLDNDSDFRVEIVATGEGTVSYSIEEVTENAEGSEITNVVEFNDIPIVAEDTITSDISMLADAEEYVVSKNEDSIEADKVEVDGVTPSVTVTPTPTPESGANKTLTFQDVTITSADNVTYSVDENGTLLALCDGTAESYEMRWQLNEPVDTTDYYKVVLECDTDDYNTAGFHWYSIDLYSDGKKVKSRSDICGGIIFEDDAMLLEIGLKNVEDCVIDEIRLSGWSRLTTEYSVNVRDITFVSETEEEVSDTGIYCEPAENQAALYCFEEYDLSAYAGKEITIQFDMKSCGYDLSRPANIINVGTNQTIETWQDEIVELDEIEITGEWQTYQVTCSIPESWESSPVYFALAYWISSVTGYDNGLCSVYYDNFKVTEIASTVTPAPTHVHEWSSDWSYNDYYHWHECEGTEGVCDISQNRYKDGYERHKYSYDRDASCNECGYIREISYEEYYPMVTPTPRPTAVPTPTPMPTATPTPEPTATPSPTPEGYYNPETSWTSPEVYEEESEKYDIFLGTSKKDASLGRTMEKGETVDLNFYGVKNWTRDAYTYKWVSSDESIATVDKNGVVTMLAEGIAIIKLELIKKDTGEVMNVAPIEVGVPAADYDVFLGTSKEDTELRRTLEISKSVDLNFYGVKGWKRENYEYEWYSTDETIATVGKSGLVTAHSAGKVVIRLKLKDLRTGEYLVVAPVVLIVPEQMKEKVTE